MIFSLLYMTKYKLYYSEFYKKSIWTNKNS